ncbi:MAG: ATP-binding protein, partial [Chromatiales bacterium]
AGLSLRVSDNGPGIPSDQAQLVLQRGHRADQRQAGQGIGLAVVVDVLNAYGGHLEIGRSAALGGAQITLSIPGT